MILPTHYTFSIFILSLIKKDPSIFLYATFSLLPDLDIKLKDHRRFLHSFLFCFLILIIFRNNLIFIPYFSHIFLDYFTYTPLTLLWPYKGKYSLRLIKSGSIIDKLLTVLFLILFLLNYFLLK
ncbi:MAG: metal-dependent hydrolase [Caldisericia bacterium]|jgi:membrane-bound metal-dependent hydrolase YbcI (DUF457 family)|nr:metal-dependent hydrolase [Caldisericia bacterium]